MKCKCGEPIKECPAVETCHLNGWVHVATAQHGCRGKRAGQYAEPAGEQS